MGMTRSLLIADPGALVLIAMLLFDYIIAWFTLVRNPFFEIFIVEFMY
jgi:hypothetical protein